MLGFEPPHGDPVPAPPASADKPPAADLPALDPQAVTERHEAVIRRIARHRKVSKRGAHRRFVEMLKFLDVCATSEETVSPPPRVDHAWHEFILFTRDYAAYCEERFGFFIHHDPAESADVDAYQRAYFDATLRFGELDGRIWPRPRAGSTRGGSGPAWFGGGGGDGGGFFSCGGGGCGGGGCGGGS